MESLLNENLKDKRSERRWRTIWRVIWLVLILVALYSFFSPFKNKSSTVIGKHTALVKIEGEIASNTPANAQDINAALQSAFESPDSVGVILKINSPGGSVDSGFAIWDQVKMITSPVTTLVTGLAASMGSILSLCAAPKRRFATPNARIMIHQPMIGGVIKGQATDLEIQAKEILKTRAALVELYVSATGKSTEVIDRAIDRDTWMSSQEAYEFGLLDGVVKSFDEILPAMK